MMLDEVFNATWSELSKKPMSKDEREELQVEYLEYISEQIEVVSDYTYSPSESFINIYKEMFIANEINWFSQMSAQEMLSYIKKHRRTRLCMMSHGFTAA